MKAYIKLMRLKNSIATVVAVIVGAMMVGTNIWVPPVFYACIVAFLIVAGGFAINDYYDRKIDIANKCNRPIPLGQIHPKNAKAFYPQEILSTLQLSLFNLYLVKIIYRAIFD